MTLSRSLFAACLVALGCVQAQAHFLWIVVDAPTAQSRVYFAESPEPDDPALLDRLAGLKLTTYEGRDKSAQSAAEKQGDALVAPAGKAYGVSLSHTYGVLERGGETFLLAYHGTAHTAPIAADWKR